VVGLFKGNWGLRRLCASEFTLRARTGPCREAARVVPGAECKGWTKNPAEFMRVEVGGEEVGVVEAIAMLELFWAKVAKRALSHHDGLLAWRIQFLAVKKCMTRRGSARYRSWQHQK
jgi:hypothetical protein